MRGRISITQCGLDCDPSPGKPGPGRASCLCTRAAEAASQTQTGMSAQDVMTAGPGQVGGARGHWPQTRGAGKGTASPCHCSLLCVSANLYDEGFKG